jgi:hypothetical protein
MLVIAHLAGSTTTNRIIDTITVPLMLDGIVLLGP